MESIKTHETGWLQRGLLVIAALVAILTVAASATLVVRHFTGTSDAPTQTTQSRGVNGDSSAGYGATVGKSRPVNGDSSSGYGVKVGIPAPQSGGPGAVHQ